MYKGIFAAQGGASPKIIAEAEKLYLQWKKYTSKAVTEEALSAAQQADGASEIRVNIALVAYYALGMRFKDRYSGLGAFIHPISRRREGRVLKMLGAVLKDCGYSPLGCSSQSDNATTVGGAGGGADGRNAKDGKDKKKNKIPETEKSEEKEIFQEQELSAAEETGETLTDEVKKDKPVREWAADEKDNFESRNSSKDRVTDSVDAEKEGKKTLNNNKKTDIDGNVKSQKIDGDKPSRSAKVGAEFQTANLKGNSADKKQVQAGDRNAKAAKPSESPDRQKITVDENVYFRSDYPFIPEAKPNEKRAASKQNFYVRDDSRPTNSVHVSAGLHDGGQEPVMQHNPSEQEISQENAERIRAREAFNRMSEEELTEIKRAMQESMERQTQEALERGEVSRMPVNLQEDFSESFSKKSAVEVDDGQTHVNQQINK
ncbi:MAG: hypothetical protein ACI4L9_04905 [Candidatus Coproplasma sp.]